MVANLLGQKLVQHHALVVQELFIVIFIYSG